MYTVLYSSFYTIDTGRYSSGIELNAVQRDQRRNAETRLQRGTRTL